MLLLSVSYFFLSAGHVIKRSPLHLCRGKRGKTDTLTLFRLQNARYLSQQSGCRIILKPEQLSIFGKNDWTVLMQPNAWRWKIWSNVFSSFCPMLGAKWITSGAKRSMHYLEVNLFPEGLVANLILSAYWWWEPYLYNSRLQTVKLMTKKRRFVTIFDLTVIIP